MTEQAPIPNKKKKKLKKRIASLQDPALEAIADGLFRFEHESQAVSMLQRLSQQFVISKEQDRIDPKIAPTLKLWIRGYNVTEDEKAKGYRGHFAKLSVKKLDGNKFTLVAEKQDVPFRLHPQKERPKFRHPNWGHPIIRAAQRNKPYAEIELARMELIRLHEEFPETSIPGRDKLHIMVYSRESLPPIKKCTIRIQPITEGGYRLELTDNIRKKEEHQAMIGAIAPQEGQAVDQADSPVQAPAGGKFTTMVKLSQKKKVMPKKKAPTQKLKEE